MEIAIIAIVAGCSIPIVALIGKTIVQLVEMRQGVAPHPAAGELTGEQALFGISAAEDLRDLKQRMDRLESQIASIANAVQGSGRPAPTRSLDPVEPIPPSEHPLLEQRS
jgi:hypothetical protein